jgi:hypothetical protein
MVNKNTFIITIILFLAMLVLLLCCDLYFPRESARGIFSDPSPVPTPLPAPSLVPTPTIPPGGNMIYNGDFESELQHWGQWINTGDGTVASVAENNNELAVSITEGTPNYWYIQVNQGYLDLMQGKSYALTFQARAAASRDIRVELGENNYDNNNDGTKWTVYDAHDMTITTVHPSPNEQYSCDFVMTYPSDQEARLIFNFGGNNNDVWIDNVSLIEVNPTPVP